MSFSLSFAEVSSLLAGMHLIDPAKEGTFRSRIKHLQRLNFPPGVNTGKGRPAEYGVEQFLLLAVAFELLQLGLTPERARSLLTQRQEEVLAAFHRAAIPPSLFYRQEYLMFLDPRALSALQFDPSEDENEIDAPHQFLMFGTMKTAIQYVRRSRTFLSPRIAIIDLYRIIVACAVMAEELGISIGKKLGDEILRWADERERDGKYGHDT